MSKPETLYRRASVSDWRAPVGPIAKLIRWWLKTGLRTTQLPGVVLVGRAALAEELELDEEVARAALDELEAAGLIVADWKARLVWVPDRLAECPPDNPNAVTSWRWVWSTVPPCALRDRIEQQLVEHLATRPQSFLDAGAVFLDVEPRTVAAAEAAGIRESNRWRNGSPNGSGNPSANGSPNPSANGSANEIRDPRSEIPLPPTPTPPTVPAAVDDEDAAWVAGWNQGADPAAKVPPVAAPSPSLLAALGAARARWSEHDGTSGWSTPRGAEGAARALVAEASTWQVVPSLERLLLRMPAARLDELMRSGEAYQPRRSLAAVATPAAAPPLDPAEELLGLDELARRAPARLTPALAARRDQLRLVLGGDADEDLVAGELRAPELRAAHRGELRTRDPTSKYSRRLRRHHIHPGLLTLPFTDALN